MQKKKGISLIVLVITIIVMIILAAAIILSLNNAGIIGNANKAVELTNNDQIQQIAQLGWADAYIEHGDNITKLREGVEKSLIANNLNPEDFLINVTTKGVLAKSLASAWVQDKDDKFKIRRGEEELIIGQTLSYDEGVDSYTGGWKVLGADDEGNLLIMSNKNVATVKLGGSERVESHASWLVGTRNITKACQEAIPIIGREDVLNVRSIEVEDINKVTGYTSKDKALFGKGYIYEYDNKVTYSYDTSNEVPTKLKFKGTKGTGNEANVSTDHTSGFYWSDRKELHHITVAELRNTANNGKTITTLTSNYYWYYPTTLTTNTSGDIKGIATDTEAYKMLFRNSSDTANAYYWLASDYIGVNTGCAFFGVRQVQNGKVYGYDLLYSYGGTHSPEYGVRAVVTLSSNVSVDDII